MLHSRFIRELENLMEEKRTAVASGNCSDIGQYKYQCGVINGLTQAVEIYKEEIKKEEE